MGTTAVSSEQAAGRASPSDSGTPSSSNWPPATGSGNTAAMHGGKEALWPHSPVSPHALLSASLL
jgi:hypothetical protein